MKAIEAEFDAESRRFVATNLDDLDSYHSCGRPFYIGSVFTLQNLCLFTITVDITLVSIEPLAFAMR